MSDEGRELAEFIRALLAPDGAGRADGPAWLGGAVVAVDPEAGPTPRVNIDCADGSRFAVPVLQFQLSRARLEQLERERAERAARPPSPEEVKKTRELLRPLAEIATGRHREEHRGPFESCHDELCTSFRETLTIVGGGIYLPDDDGPVN